MVDFTCLVYDIWVYFLYRTHSYLSDMARCGSFKHVITFLELYHCSWCWGKEFCTGCWIIGAQTVFIMKHLVKTIQNLFLPDTVEPPFSVYQFKVFPHLMLNFKDSKYVIVKFPPFRNFLSFLFKYAAPKINPKGGNGSFTVVIFHFLRNSGWTYKLMLSC